MNCPKCPGVLEIKDIEHISLAICPICHGIWVRPEILKEVLNRSFFHVAEREIDSEELESTSRPVDLEQKQSHCPTCPDQKDLEPYLWRSENLEHCKSCNHIWLNGGQISDLQKTSIKTYLIIFTIIFAIISSFVLLRMFKSNAQSLKKDFAIIAEANRRAQSY